MTCKVDCDRSTRRGKIKLAYTASIVSNLKKNTYENLFVHEHELLLLTLYHSRHVFESHYWERHSLIPLIT